MAAIPVYQVIYEDLLDQIASGAFKPDDRLPSEAALADQYGVSRMTVRHAIDQLEKEYTLVRRRGAGTFVLQGGTRYRRLNRLTPFREEMGVSDATEVKSVLLAKETLQPPEEVAEGLNLKPRQEAIRIERVRSVNGTPAAIQESWVPYIVAPSLVREDLVGDSLYRTLSERFGITLRWAEQQISAAAATEAQAKLLELEVGSPLLAVVRQTYSDQSKPIEFVRSWSCPQFPLLIRLEA